MKQVNLIIDGELMELTERFKEMSGFGKKYMISSYGRVWNVLSNKFLKQQETDKGYLTVHLFKGSKHYNKRVHRLVAQAFIPNPKNLPEVNHKDGVKFNNHVDNLEWSTGDDNIKHAQENGLNKCVEGAGHYKAKLTDVIVLEIRKRPVDGVYSSKELSQEFNISTKTIRDIIQRKTWKHI